MPRHVHTHSLLHVEDFPPNPSRGLEVPPVVVGVRACAVSGIVGATARLTTEGVLVDVALPDFSMPFNVVTLCSTLLAFFFGSMLNVVVRKGRRKREEGKGKGKDGGVVGRTRETVRLWMARWRGGEGRPKKWNNEK